MKAVPREDEAVQRIAPVVVVADDDGWQVSRGAKDLVMQQVVDLPAPLPLAQAEVPVDHVQRPLRRVDDHQLRPARLLPLQPQGDVVPGPERPARQR